ncbi:MAG: hypothetical protein R3F24_14980 [Gammaproteobacteria bacterium]
MFISDEEHDRILIRNEETLRRRAWIEHALAAVRERMMPEETGEPVPVSTPEAGAGTVPAPRLYLVRNSSTR